MRNRHKYHQDWFLIIRPEILKRDNYKCSKCNIKHRSCIAYKKTDQIEQILKSDINEFRKEGYKAYQVYLQVAHIDSNPDNNNYSNLISLCPIHHFALDKEQRNLKRIAKFNN